LLKAGFVPRPNQIRVISLSMGWETSLLSPWKIMWNLTWSKWTPLEGSTRRALISSARKTAKKMGTTRVAHPPGRVVTSRPVGTRMGKGKGKPLSTRGWLPRGSVFLSFRGLTPPPWGYLSKRSPRGTTLVKPIGW